MTRLHAALLEHRDTAGFAIVLVSVAASVVIEDLLPFSVLVCLLVFAAYLVLHKGLVTATPVDAAMLLVLVMAGVSFAVSIDRSKSLIQVSRLLTGIALFYAIITWVVDRRRLAWVVGGTILAGVGLALLAPFTVEWALTKIPAIPVNIYDNFVTLVSDTIHRNVMAGSLVILVPIPLSLLIFAWADHSRWTRVAVSLSFLLMTGMLLLTQTRGAWLAYGVLVLSLIIMRWPKTWYIIPVGIIAAVGGVIIVGVNTTLNQISSLVDVGGFDQRIDIWSRAIYMLEDFPLTGVGMGTFGDVADLLYPFFLSEPGEIPHAHNLFLQVGVDLGLPGLIAWMAIFLTVAWVSFQTFRHGRQSGNHWVSALGAGLFASQIGLLVHGQVDAVWWGMIRPAPLLWGLWGLALASWSIFCSQRLRIDRPSTTVAAEN